MLRGPWSRQDLHIPPLPTLCVCLLSFKFGSHLKCQLCCKQSPVVKAWKGIGEVWKKWWVLKRQLFIHTWRTLGRKQGRMGGLQMGTRMCLFFPYLKALLYSGFGRSFVFSDRLPYRPALLQSPLSCQFHSLSSFVAEMGPHSPDGQSGNKHMPFQRHNIDSL